MEGRAGPLGRLKRLLVCHYNAWTASNTLGLRGGGGGKQAVLVVSS